MKQKLFAILLLFQAAFILLVPLQHHLIGDYGKTIQLLGNLSPYYYYDETRNILYFEYEINTIPEEKWEVSRELDFQEKLYVIVKPDENGIYEVVRATDKKPDIGAEETILLAKYSYYHEVGKEYQVEYGIEELKWEEEIEEGKRLLIHVNIAPWGQKVVREIAPVD